MRVFAALQQQPIAASSHGLCIAKTKAARHLFGVRAALPALFGESGSVLAIYLRAPTPGRDWAHAPTTSAAGTPVKHANFLLLAVPPSVSQGALGWAFVDYARNIPRSPNLSSSFLASIVQGRNVRIALSQAVARYFFLIALPRRASRSARHRRFRDSSVSHGAGSLAVRMFAGRDLVPCNRTSAEALA